ncbi:MAG: glycosyltransferase, partial [Myxococcaceae bacterium]|nr:glycosyltransferase [Myxococcaceae bacterium]
RRTALFCHLPLSRHHWLDRLVALRPPAQVLANSAFSAVSVSELLPGKNVAVVGCPVEEREPPHAGLRARVRTELGVPEDRCVIIQVSRMEAGKGHLLLLESLARLDAADAPWECWVVGGAQRTEERSYEARVRREAEFLGLNHRVRFLGERRDVPRLLAAADIFCQANTGPEAFGIVFGEAMLARLPVLTTDMGGAREVVSPDTGARVAPRPEALAAVLHEWMRDAALRAQLGEAGRHRALTLYSPLSVLDALERALRP